MKVQHDTGWHSFINRALTKKHTDQIKKTEPKLSQRSSTSSLTDVWTAKYLRERKNHQKLQKRHRFPPSLLTSRAADFWNTLMPLRANCSCSSVSVDDKSSSLKIFCPKRSSLGVSISDATFSSNLEKTVLPIREAPVRETLGDALQHTHLTFESLIARMVRLFNFLNEKSDSSSSRICSDSNLKILPSLDSNLEKNTEMIAHDSYCRFPSVTSLSSNSVNYYRDNWYAVGRTRKKWGSSSKFEIAEQKRQFSSFIVILFIAFEWYRKIRGNGFFSPSPLVSKTLRVPKNVLSKEELVYLLQNKKSLLSEYFQRKVDSTDLEKDLNPSERKTLIYGTQSDSRLQEHNLLRFVQFIRERRKKDAEGVVKKKSDSLETIKSNSNFTPSNKEDSRNLATPKRRVTFSDPLARNDSSLINCYSSDNEDGISPEQSFTTVITNNIDQKTHSEVLFDSESVFPSDSSVFLKTCHGDLSLTSLSPKDSDLNPGSNESIMEDNTVRQKNTTDGRTDFDHPEHNHKINFQENDPWYETLDLDTAENESHEKTDTIINESLISPFQRLSEEVEMIEEELPDLKFLVKEILDCGTTHVPILDHVGPSIILQVDDTTPRVTFEECSSQENFEKCLKIKICPVEIREDCKSDGDDHCTSDCEVEEKSIRNKITKFGNIQRSKITDESNQQELSRNFYNEQKFSDAYVNSRVFCPSGKTVTFEDEKEFHQSLRCENKQISSSKLNGRFDLSWKGCWDQKKTTQFLQNTRQRQVNQKENEHQLFESNSNGTLSQSVVSTPNDTYTADPDLFSENRDLSNAISGSRTSYCTTMNDEGQSANNYMSRQRRRNSRANSPLPYPHPSNNPSFKEIADSLEEDEPIPWTVMSREDFSKLCKPASKLIRGLESNSEASKLPNRTELQKVLSDACKGIVNPEIWRSEVRSAFPKSDWYTQRDYDKYSWKLPEMRNDWLFKKLEELQSNTDTDYESDYYVESEIESDFECGRDVSLINRSISNLDMRSQNCRKFKMRRNRFRRGLFLDKIFSKKKIILNGCRCRKNSRSNRYDLRPRDHDLRHTTLHESDQQSNQNIFSHLRARIILDSETEDSDFAPSIQTDFRYNFNRKDDHVNKMKCRRFVKSLRSINSEEDRQFSSTGLLDVTFKKSFSPASVQSALSTRTVGTNVSEKGNFYNMIDVCIDTCDLCRYKSIEKLHLNKHSSCQTVESSFIPSKLLESTEKAVPKLSPFLFEIDKSLESDSQISRNDEQRISNVLVNLSNHINTASNNLAKLRFSEISNKPGTVVPLPAIEEDTLNTFSSQAQSTRQIFPRSLQRVKILADAQNTAQQAGNISNNSNSHTDEDPSCRICKSYKKPSGRYLLPACIVKGTKPDPKTNEKDPWNRVMEQAKAQRSQVACSALESRHPKSSDRKQKSFVSDQFYKEKVKMQLVQVKQNSSQAEFVYDLEHPTAVDKIQTPPFEDRAIKLPSASVLCSSIFADRSLPNLPRTRSPKKNRKAQAVPNMSNRLLYIISEKAELSHQVPIKFPAANFFA